MRAAFGFLLALLFAVHIAYAASPRQPECCEEICADIHCVIASCACQPVTLPTVSNTRFVPAAEVLTPAVSVVILKTRIEDIWRPPWRHA